MSAFSGLLSPHLLSKSDLGNLENHQHCLSGKESVCNAGDAKVIGLISGSERSPGGGMITYSSILAWEIPWTEECSGLQSIGS